MQENNKLKSPQNQEQNRMVLPDSSQIQNSSVLSNSQFVKKMADSQVSSLFSIDYEIIKKRYIHQGILGRGRDSYLQIFNVSHILVDSFTNEKRVLQVFQSLPLDVFVQKLDNLYKASFQSFVSNQQQILGFSTKKNDDKTFDLYVLYDFENFNSNVEELIQNQISQGKKQFSEEELWDFAYFLVDSFYLGSRNSQEFLDISPINIYFTEDQSTKKRKYSISNLGFQGNKKQDKKFYLPSDRFFQPLKPNEKKKPFEWYAKAQIFQIGMIILYMASLEDPNLLYSEILQSETKSLNAEQLQQRIQSLGYSEKLKAFLQQLLSLREEKRITIEELISTEKGNQLMPRQYFYHKGKIGEKETYDGFVIKHQNQFVPHGLGYLESNNQHFKGHFDQGEFTGNGVWHDGNTKFIYGKFKSNEISHGIFINKNQFIFAGSLKDFKPSEGDGIYHSLSNNLQDDLFFCQGKFGDNLKMINGKKYYKDGTIKDDSVPHDGSKQKTVQQQQPPQQQVNNNNQQQQPEKQQKQQQQQPQQQQQQQPQPQQQQNQQNLHQKAKILQYSSLDSVKKQVIKTGNALQSDNKLYFLLMQENGNLALYKTHEFISKNMLWESGTKGNGNYLRMQDDGNLVVYDVQDQPLWASNSNEKGSKPYQFICQGDGNLVVYDKSQTPIWASNTQQVQEDNEHNHSNTIFSEGKIPQNGTLQANNKCGYVKMQEDGNLVVYDHDNKELWASNSEGKGETGNYKCFVQNDGNLVVYDKNKQPIWASNTNNKGTKPYRLIMQDDRNLVLYDSQNQALWATSTNH